MARFFSFIIALSVCGCAYSFDILEVELGESFPNDPGPSSERLNAILPADTITVSNSGALKSIFPDFDIWVLNETKRRAAIVMASRAFQELSECKHTKLQLRAVIADKLGTPDFPFSETVETDPYAGTEYIFFCATPGGSPYVLLNFVIRNGKMGKELQRISNEKLWQTNKRYE